MSGSVDPEVSKKDGALIRPADDRAQGGDGPALFTEQAMLRIEEGLRAQREQQNGSRFSAPDTASSPPRSAGAWQDQLVVRSQIEPTSESPSLAPADQSNIRTEELVPSPSWGRLKVGLLLCSLLLVAGAAALAVSLKARTGRSTDAAPINIETRGPTASVPPENDGPRQPMTNAVKSSATSRPPLSPAPPNQQPVEAQEHAVPAASEIPAPPNTAVETQGPTAPAASEIPPPPNAAVEARVPAAPATSETVHRHHPTTNRSKRKGPPRRRPSRRSTGTAQ